MSKFVLQESNFPLDAWGQVCRDVYSNSKNKNAKFPCYDAIKDTAKLAICVCAIDSTSPSSINLNFPGIVIREADNSEKSCGSWPGCGWAAWRMSRRAARIGRLRTRPLQ